MEPALYSTTGNRIRPNNCSLTIAARCRARRCARATKLLRENILHYLAVHIGEAEVPPLKFVRQAQMVHAQAA